MCVCVYSCMYVCKLKPYVCMYVCHVCVYACMYVCMYILMYVCMCVCVCMYVCTCILRPTEAHPLSLPCKVMRNLPKIFFYIAKRGMPRVPPCHARNFFFPSLYMVNVCCLSFLHLTWKKKFHVKCLK